MSIGEFAAAREHLEQAVALYDFDRHRSLGPQYGDDPGVTSLGFLALALWFLGHPDRALERSRAGEALAERLAAPYSIAFARDFRAWVHVRRGEPAAALACSDALVTLAAEQGFDFFRAEGTIFRGWARAQQGDVDSGIAEMRDGVAAHRASGAEMGRPSHLALLAETYAAARQPDAGLAVLEEALATVAATGERSNEADLYRLKGECLRQKAKSAGRKALVEEAEACLHEALAIARRQGACVFALRAALALCQLRETRRDGGAARRLLAEIHAGFREGFDTADLRAVRRVLRGS
jgi:adenylate cyclase